MSAAFHRFCEAHRRVFLRIGERDLCPECRPRCGQREGGTDRTCDLPYPHVKQRHVYRTKADSDWPSPSPLAQTSRGSQ